MKPRSHSQQELRKAAGHVSYEIEMIIYAGKELGGFHSSPMAAPDGQVKNIALESFLLHFRNLRAFLCPSLQAKKIFDDDVVASDFIGKAIAEDCGNKSVFDLEEKKRLDKMLAHISYNREEYIADGKHGWKTAKMLALILEQLENFFTTLPSVERAWFPTPKYLSDAKTLATSLAIDLESDSRDSYRAGMGHMDV